MTVLKLGPKKNKLSNMLDRDAIVAAQVNIPNPKAPIHAILTNMFFILEIAKMEGAMSFGFICHEAMSNAKIRRSAQLRSRWWWTRIDSYQGSRRGVPNPPNLCPAPSTISAQTKVPGGGIVENEACCPDWPIF